MLAKSSKILLTSLIGCIFLFSGYSKLYPIEPFEYTFVDLGIGNWETAPFISRFLIGVEVYLGILFLFNFGIKKTGYRLANLLLILFSVYLIGLMLFTGNKGNCGCFGTMLVMTPFQALVKNIGMLGILFWLKKNHEGWEVGKWNRTILLLLIGVSIALPFILNPVELNYSKSYLDKKQDQFSMELDTLYKYASLNVPPKELSNGKHVIAFLSLTCKHCRIAANKMRIIHERNPSLSFYFVLNGKKENLAEFFEDTHTEDIAHCMLNGRAFIYLAGTELPGIYLVNKGMVEHQLNYFTLDQQELENWFGKP